MRRGIRWMVLFDGVVVAIIGAVIGGTVGAVLLIAGLAAVFVAWTAYRAERQAARRGRR